LPPHFTAPAAPVLDPVARTADAETFFRNTGADIRVGGDRAYYAVHNDYVQMPPFEIFKDAESYYAT
jgi:antirestriction protein ArdC